MFFLHILILYHLLEEVIFTLYYLYTTTTQRKISFRPSWTNQGVENLPQVEKVLADFFKPYSDIHTMHFPQNIGESDRQAQCQVGTLLSNEKVFNLI